MNDEGYRILLEGFNQPVFRSFEGYLKTERIPEDDIKLILKQYKPFCITYELPPGIYTSKDILNYVDKVSKRDLQREYDDISMQTNLNLRSLLSLMRNRFQYSFGFHSILGF